MGDGGAARDPHLVVPGIRRSPRPEGQLAHRSRRRLAASEKAVEAGVSLAGETGPDGHPVVALLEQHEPGHGTASTDAANRPSNPQQPRSR